MTALFAINKSLHQEKAWVRLIPQGREDLQWHESERIVEPASHGVCRTLLLFGDRLDLENANVLTCEIAFKRVNEPSVHMR